MRICHGIDRDDAGDAAVRAYDSIIEFACDGDANPNLKELISKYLTIRCCETICKIREKEKAAQQESGQRKTTKSIISRGDDDAKEI